MDQLEASQPHPSIDSRALDRDDIVARVQYKHATTPARCAFPLAGSGRQRDHAG